MRKVHKNLLNKNDLPHTVMNAYAHPVRKITLKEYGLPHAVVEWYVHHEHEKIRFAPHCC